MTALVLPALFVAGVAAWQLGEYVLHRFAFHERKIEWKGSIEHLRHHAGVDQAPNTTLLSWAGIWTVGAVLFGPIGWLIAGIPGGIAMGLGWVAGYYLYEYIHWAEHRYPPSNRYTRWARRHHFHHHFGAPLKNHGVTTPVFDFVFGTYEKPGRIRIPRRLAPITAAWMLDEQGDVKAEFAEEYFVAGARDRDEARRDLDRIEAFANQTPSL